MITRHASASCVPCACEGACEVVALLSSWRPRFGNALTTSRCEKQIRPAVRVGLSAFGPRGLKRGPRGLKVTRPTLTAGRKMRAPGLWPKSPLFRPKILWREKLLCCLLQSMMRSGPKPSSDCWQPVQPLIQNSGRPSMPVNGRRSRPRLQVSEDGFKIAMHKP